MEFIVVKRKNFDDDYDEKKKLKSISLSLDCLSSLNRYYKLYVFYLEKKPLEICSQIKNKEKN